jgi:hypothetical protein
MSPQDGLGLVRTILRTLGLSPEAVDEIVARILDLLGGKDRKAEPAEYPYHVRDDFLSPAEQSFFQVLRTVAADWALVCPKVGLADLFYAKSSDPSLFRTATNRIDRKHVDFLLCDPHTAKPLIGIELDDRSHQRPDRQERDEFVEHVFDAARLPLVRVNVRRGYVAVELESLLRTQLGQGGAVTSPAATASPAVPPPQVTGPSLASPVTPPRQAAGPTATSPSGSPQYVAVPVSTPANAPEEAVKEPAEQPRCPQCNTPMVLRTASRGANQGGKFWGCPNYPRCRGVVKYDG